MAKASGNAKRNGAGRAKGTGSSGDPKAGKAKEPKAKEPKAKEPNAGKAKEPRSKEEKGGKAPKGATAGGSLVATLAADQRPPKLPRTEKVEEGRTLRSEVPRASHAAFTPAPDRADPIDILVAQAKTRVPDLVPIRYGRMMASPFAFYRGAAAVMAADLAGTPVSGIDVQASGDAHLMNFGVFATPERNLVFGQNDFDETLPGPWEWDLKRLVTSLVVAGRSNGFGPEANDAVVRVALTSYRDRIRAYATMRTLDVWYSRIDVEQVLDLIRRSGEKKMVARTARTIDKARSRDSMQAVAKLTQMTEAGRRFIDDPPLIQHMPVTGLEETVQAVFDEYRQSLTPETAALLDRFTLVDIARKVVGVGSVGTRCWVLLLEGAGDDDPLVLQAKEAQASVLEAHLAPSAYANHAERVVHGQRLIQPGSDIFLGWTENKVTGVHYYVRQLRDIKGSAVVETMDVEALASYGGLCAWALARAHSKSGDPARIAGYLGSGNEFAKAVARFAADYADQNERDHQALVDAVRSGRVHAIEGV